jgi:hypothetical protein
MINILSLIGDAVQYSGRSGGALLLHHTVEDEKQFAIGIRLL